MRNVGLRCALQRVEIGGKPPDRLAQLPGFLVVWIELASRERQRTLADQIDGQRRIGLIHPTLQGGRRPVGLVGVAGGKGVAEPVESGLQFAHLSGRQLGLRRAEAE